MNRFDCYETFIKGVYVVKAKPIEDFRGFYSRYFCTEEFKEVGLSKPICQINHSKSIKAGTVRGLHYQKKPFGETKIVRCIRGSIWDVAVDIRKDSPTYLQHFAIELNDTNQTFLFIPPGFAHAFQSLKDNTEVLYLVDETFHPDYVVGLNPTDPLIGIKWPLPISVLSEKERTCRFIGKDFKAE